MQQTDAKYLILGGLGLLSGAMASAQAAPAKAQRQPNVVIFFSDDQGAIDINRYGSSDLYTPNMDRLCDMGTRFTNFYSNSSISTPSRAALMTGRYPQRCDIERLPPPNASAVCLPAREVTIAEVLRGNGYRTAVIGKWHLGYHPESLPGAHGFDYSFGHLGGCIDNYSHYFYWSGPNKHDLYRDNKEVWLEGQNFARLMAEESVAFIEHNKDRPFFLYFASNYPHYPLQGDAKWREYYKDMPSPRNKYAAMVSTLDEKIGIVIDKLENEGLLESTIIIFMSDNGFSTEERTFFGGGSAGDLKGSKFSPYEGGIRVPAMICYPPKIAAGKTCDRIGAGFDWFPTILDLCGIPQPKHILDGRSLVPAITADKPSPHTVLNWGMPNGWAVRKGDYKLVGINGPNNSVKIELYDMRADVNETRDIAAANPQVVAQLKAEHERWLKDTAENK